jgi:hypothetical protein
MDQEIREWTSIAVGRDNIGAFLNCGDGIEAYDADDVLLGVFADEDSACNAISDCWDRKFWSNGGDANARVNQEPGPAQKGNGQGEPPSDIANDPLTIARNYLERGWNPIPVSRRTKKPIGKEWQHRRLDGETVAKAFNRADMNVGVQSGPMSNGLTDVDLDCREAVAIGAMLLPESNNVFGCASKPRSHWLYSTNLADKIPRACLQFKDIDGTMMLELKIGGGGKGTQSVFPGSTHTSGEAIAWDQDGQLATLEDDQLLRQVRRLAVAVMLARHWPEEGARHDAALTVGGLLARAGLNEDATALMLEAIATAAGDEQAADRAQAGRDAVRQHDKGGDTRGLPKLVDIFGEKVASKVAEWLNYKWQPQAPVTGGVTPADFCAYLPDHSYIFTPTGTFWSKEGINACLGRGVNKRIDAYQPTHHLTWAPGHPMLIENQLVIDGELVERNGVMTFNLYRPPMLKYGDPAKSEPWLELVHKVYPNDAARLITYLAHRVQRPGEKINHGLVMGGAPGIGKDTIIEPAKRAVGAWNCKEVSPQQILGRFNGYLKSVILRVSEVRDLGEFNRYQFYEHMKAYLAAPPDVLRVDEKNVPEHDVMNCVAIIFTTNHLTDGIFLPPDDRRHDVMWSELTKDDFEEGYWNRIWGWYDAGGDSHVAAYLSTLDLSRFNPKAPPPKTAAFWAIVDANRAPEEGELQDVLDKLGNPDAVTLEQTVKAAGDAGLLDIMNWLTDRKNRRSIPHRFDAAGYTPVRNDARDTGLWVVAGVRQAVYAKKTLSLRERLKAVVALQHQAPKTQPRRLL